ncbi:hypothetical protein BSZ39_11145 [Bowdeniella nasicola]|uniref:Phage shock protein PspC N-terminal domain-containing protein n=1 Tax=Bowdeniella nasicola TaxID=208480 RepID=A0A1Q5PZS3_9ACTO|nr:PspC domain-containing protein [Bowdeniella nasicola]OKL53131.1 hypothetical protein BSZ39_11145 [Bowdeniella nasicola]
MGFFETVRSRPLRRTDDRIFGGVCAGLAHRWGIAPLLVRLLFVLAALIGGLPLVLYGIGWLLLPEYKDGRIHLQELFRGRPDIAVAAALGMIVVGSLRPILWFGSTLDTLRDIIPLMYVLAVIGIGILALVILARALASRRRGGTPEAPAPAVVDTDAPIAAFEALEPSPAPAPRPRKPRTPVIEPRFAMGVIAIAIALGALTLLLRPNHLGAWLIAAGVALAVIAVGLIIAAARQRRGTWLTAASWLLGPALAFVLGLSLTLPEAVLSTRDIHMFEQHLGPDGTNTAFASNVRIPVSRDSVSATAGIGVYDIPDDGSQPLEVRVHASGYVVMRVSGFGGWEVTYPDGTTSEVEARVSTTADGQLELHWEFDDVVVTPGQSASYRNAAAKKNPQGVRIVQIELGNGDVRISPEFDDPTRFIIDKLGVTPPSTDATPKESE